MPIYEYRCKFCNNHFESLRSRADADTRPAPCPTCQSPVTMRLLSTFAARVGVGKMSEIGDGQACETSANFGVPCCGGGCRLPQR